MHCHGPCNQSGDGACDCGSFPKTKNTSACLYRCINTLDGILSCVLTVSLSPTKIMSTENSEIADIRKGYINIYIYIQWISICKKKSLLCVAVFDEMHGHHDPCNWPFCHPQIVRKFLVENDCCSRCTSASKTHTEHEN